MIYKILNQKTNRYYIGSTGNFKKRVRAHKLHLNRNRHHSFLLQRAWNANGQKNFTFTILETCDTSVKLEREQYYIDRYKPYYNIAKSTAAPMQGRTHSDETKQKMRVWPRPSGEAHHLHGTTQTEEHKQKLSIAHTGLTRSDETKLKMRETAIKQNRYTSLIHSIEAQKRKIIDSNHHLHESLLAASEFHNISVSTICDNLKGRSKKTRKGITFRYAIGN